MSQIHIKYLFDKESIYEIELIDTILVLKEKIQKQEGIPIQAQRLKVGDIELDNNKTFNDYNIKNGDFITIIIRLEYFL